MTRADGYGKAPLLSGEAYVVGAIGTVLAGLIALTVFFKFGEHYFFLSDGRLFEAVARNPFSNGHALRGIAPVYGDSYRYGRIFYPLLAWTVGLGRPGAIRFAMIAIDAAGLGISIGIAGELCRRHGHSARLGLAVLAAPGVFVSVLVAVSEPVVLALTLTAYLLAIDGRRRMLIVCAALLLLTREAAGVALLPLVWRDVQGGPRRLMTWVWALAPLLAWWTWVRVRVGQWPPLDPSLSRRQALALPLLGYIKSARHGFGADIGLAFALAAITVVSAAFLLRSRPVWPVTQGAVLSSLVLLCLGPNATRFPGETVRLMSLPQALIVVAFCCRYVASGSANSPGAGAHGP